MKKNVFYCLLAVLGFVFLPSCDKDNNETVDYAAEIAKTYDGALSISCDEFTANQLTINRTETNKIQLKLNGFSLGSVVIGDIIVNDITVTKSDSIRFQTENKTITVALNGVPMPVLISIGGAYLNGNLGVRISVNVELTQMQIPVVFSSDKSLIGTDPGCSDGGGEDPDPTDSFDEIWNAIEGDYDGILSSPMVPTLQLPCIVNVVKVSEEAYTINVTINDIPYFEGGSVVVTNVAVEKKEGVCTFYGSVEVEGNTVTITGKALGVGKIKFDASILPAMSFLPISYSGEKMEE